MLTGNIRELNDKTEIPVGSDVRVSQIPKKPSSWWYLLPIFLGFIGGIIGYFALRNKNKAIAKNVLIVGLVMVFVAELIIVPAVMAVSFNLFGLTRPMVAMESGSMIPHIQIGDIIFVESVDRTKIITYNEGKETGYSTFDEYGDVILYKPRGRDGVTPIIHRAMFYVEEGQPMWPGGPAAPFAGYITKGDNPKTNSAYDQQGSISPHIPVKPEWVIGVARFDRIPWLGCVSLASRRILTCFN